MKNFVEEIEDLLRAHREGRVLRYDINRLKNANDMTVFQLSASVKNETEFSGLSSLVKEACVIDLKERLKIAAQANPPEIVEKK